MSETIPEHPSAAAPRKRTFAPPPNAQLFDEVTIRTVPRFKNSEYSGSMWRIGAVVELKYKGKVLEEERFSTAEDAALRVATLVQRLEAKWIARSEFEAFCDQEGCSEQAINVYKMKKTYCQKCAHPRDFYPPADDTVGAFLYHRKFCARHSGRGTQDYDDRDENYVLVDGPGTVQQRASDESVPAVIVMGGGAM